MPKIVLARDANGVPLYGYDFDEGMSKRALYVWNTDTLAWERMKQPILELTGDLTVTMGDVEKLLAANYFLNIQYDYDAEDNCIYKGMNTDLGAGDSDTDWYITKYDYTTGNCTQKRVRITSWSDRTSGW